MVKLYSVFLLAAFMLVNSAFAQVAINTTGNNANSTAMLDVESSSKGILIPRMSTAQRTGIAGPATGLLVYDNNTSSFWYYSGSAWTELITNLAGWKLTGNSGTDTSINFLGTTDAKDLRIRVNNTRAGVIGVNGNLFLGVNAGNPNSIGSSNIGIGGAAMQNMGSAVDNIGVGAFSLFTNTTGFQNTSTGSSSLYYNNGNGNTANGYQSLYSNLLGSVNTAIGYQSMYFNTSSKTNTAVGAYSLYSNTTGYSNVAVGVDALSHNTTKTNLVAVGDSALFSNGQGALFALQSSFNTAVGSKALYSNTLGNYNTALGYQSLYSTTTSTANTGLGAFALSFNTTGNRNSALGQFALYNNTTAHDNAAVGAGALFYNTTGHSNVAIGTEALYLNSTASNSIAIGDSALRSNTSGGVSGTQGQDNVAIGLQAMYSNTQGSSNTAMGTNAMYFNTTGTYNTVLGYGADVVSGTLSNATAIGANAKVGASNSMVLGSINGVGGATSDVNVGIGTTTPSAKLHIKHNSYPTPTLLLEESENDFARMRFTNTISNSFWELNARPQTTTAAASMEFWNNSNNTVTTPLILYGNGNATLAGTLTQNSDARLKKNIQPIHNALSAISQLNGYTYNWKDKGRDPSQQVGVIAQEVQAIFPGLVSEDQKGTLSVNYSGLIPVLIEALKEQQKQIDELKKLIQKQDRQ